MINLILKLKRLSSLARLSLESPCLVRIKTVRSICRTVSKFAIRLLLYTTITIRTVAVLCRPRNVPVEASVASAARFSTYRWIDLSSER